jgi:hypothetical protein
MPVMGKGRSAECGKETPDAMVQAQQEAGSELWGYCATARSSVDQVLTTGHPAKGGPSRTIAPLMPGIRSYKPQESVRRSKWRAGAAEAGDAVMVFFHPLVKVIIFPTSFSAVPLFQASGRATCAATPASRSGVRNKTTLRIEALAT